MLSGSQTSVRTGLIIESALKLILLLLTLFVPTQFQNSALAEDAQAVPGEYIIKFDMSKLEALRNNSEILKKYSTEAIEKVLLNRMKLQSNEELPLVNAEVVQADLKEFFDIDFALRLYDSGIIEYMEPNYIVSTDATPNDSSYSSLWGMNNTGQTGGTADVDVDAPQAWDITTGSNNIVVGVVDTGIDYTHPDLAANMWRNPGEVAGNGIDDDNNGVIDDVFGYNAITNSGNPLDDHNHGTHCSGTIGGVGNNGQGVAGVNWNVKLMGLKFLSSSGSGSIADAIKAVNYAVMMKQRGVNIRVLSNSWGGGGYSQAMEDAIRAANTNNILFVAAAGNSTSNNDNTPNYPSNYNVPNVLAVAAIDHNGLLASFSSYGRYTVDLAAPGVNIYSTVKGGGYASYSGTSMATPHVSGVAALVLSQTPGYTPAQLKDQLMSTVKLRSNLTNYMVAGGVISAKRALNANGNRPPALSIIANQTISRSADTVTVPLSASDPDGNPITFSATVSPSNKGTVTISGNNVIVDPIAGFIGTLAVTVAVTDGEYSDSKNFSVTVANQTPTLATIPVQYMTSRSGSSLQVAITAADPDGDALTYDMRVINPAQLAYDLSRSYGLFFTGSDYLNYYGQGERWLRGSSAWYFITPAGALYRDGGSFSGSTLLAQLSPVFHQTLSLLYNAQSPAQLPVTGSVTAGSLSLTLTSSYTGAFFVEYSVTDGAITVKRTFTVTVANRAPVIGASEAQSGSVRTNPITIPLSIQDPDGDTLTTTLQVLTVAGDAWNLKQGYDFYAAATDYYNYYGMNEKWFRARIGEVGWYYIKPSGAIYKDLGSPSNGRLIATLDQTYWTTPSKLYTATQPVGSGGYTVSVSNGNLILQHPGQPGVVKVKVTTSDSVASVSKNLTITIANRAPALLPITNRSMPRGQDFISVPFSATDPDGDTVTVTGRAVDAAAKAYDADQAYDFVFKNSWYTNDSRVYNEKWFWSTTKGKWSTILPDGSVYLWSGSPAASTLITKLNASYYANPALLFNVGSPAPAPVTISTSGQNLIVNPDAGFEGALEIVVTATDGIASDSKSFTLSVTNQSPTLAVIGDQTFNKNQSPYTVAFSAADADGDSLTVTTAIESMAKQVYRLDTTYKFYRPDNFFYNYTGNRELWIPSETHGWHIITPDGTLYKWNGGTLANATVLARLDASYYSNTALIYNATNTNVAVPATVTVSGATLRVTLTNLAYTGGFFVVVTASDGSLTAQRTFKVTVTTVASSKIPVAKPKAPKPTPAKPTPKLPAKPKAPAAKTGASSIEVPAVTDPTKSQNQELALGAPLYGVWNTFNSMTNILELTNPGSETKTALVTVFSSAGQMVQQHSVSVSGNVSGRGQFDLILDRLPANAYGIVAVDFKGSLDGRMFFYGADSNNGEMVFGVPLVKGTSGISNVGFDNQVSDSGQSTVLNWLSLLNLSNSSAKFVVNTFSQTGELLLSRNITVRPYGRVDIDGGHGLGVAAGSHEVVALNSNTNYRALLTAYSLDNDYALPVFATSGEQALYVALNSTERASSSIELVNSTPSNLNISVVKYSNLGEFSDTILLGAHGRILLTMDELFGDSALGYVRFISDQAGSLVARKIEYFNGRDNSLSASTTAAHSSGSDVLYGTFNTYLGMKNTLLLTNISDDIVAVRLSVGNQVQLLNLPAHSTESYGMETLNNIAPAENSYGIISVTAANSGAVLAEMERAAYDGTDIDFSATMNLR